jgi:hypothetical protein
VSGQSLALDGKPWKFVADTAWWLTEKLSPNPPQLAQYLDMRRNQGFNAIIVGTDGAWFDGSASKPKEAIFSALDSVVGAIEGRGMFLILTCQMHQYDGNGKPILVLPRSDAVPVGQYFGKRYGKNRSIAIWMVGGLDDKGVVSNNDIMNIANGIRSMDAGHLITFHPRANYTTVDAFPPGPNHQVALYQSYHTLDYASHEAAFKKMKATGLPFANIEGPFEGEPGVSSDDVVKVANMAAKWAVCGFAYGHHLVWQFANGWQGAMDTSGVRGFLKAAKG